jgi:hypothetical protein
MPRAGFEPTITVQAAKTYALDRAASGIGMHKSGYIPNSV